jgi:hypothetical protein
MVVRNNAKIMGVVLCICGIDSERPKETGKERAILIIRRENGVLK